MVIGEKIEGTGTGAREAEASEAEASEADTRGIL